MTDVSTLYAERKNDGGTIRLEKRPEGWVLWFDGKIVWRSWVRAEAAEARVRELEARLAAAEALLKQVETAHGRSNAND